MDQLEERILQINLIKKNLQHSGSYSNKIIDKSALLSLKFYTMRNVNY